MVIDIDAKTVLKFGILNLKPILTIIRNDHHHKMLFTWLISQMSVFGFVLVSI